MAYGFILLATKVHDCYPENDLSKRFLTGLPASPAVMAQRYRGCLYRFTLRRSPLAAYTARPSDAPRCEYAMKPEIHPAYTSINVVCSCGNKFETGSTLGTDLSVEVCSACHPFYTGKQKVVDTGGRVDRFRKKYAAQTPAA